MAINRKMLSRVAAAAVVIGLAGAGYFFLQHTHRAKASATRPRRGGRAGDRGRRREAGRAADRARHRHGAGLQHGGHQDPRRRRDRQGVLQRRPGRQGGRSALPDRSAAVPGGARPGAGGQGTQRGAARERPARPQSLQRRSARRVISRARASTSRRRSCARSRARSPPTRRRSSTPGSISTMPTSARRSTAAPARAWSISAISSRRRRRPAWSASPR